MNQGKDKELRWDANEIQEIAEGKRRFLFCDELTSGFEEGDLLHLRGYSNLIGGLQHYTGDSLFVTVTHVERWGWIPEDHCIISVRIVGEEAGEQRLTAIRNLLKREAKADIERLCDAVMESITKSVFEKIDAAFERVTNTKGENDESKR